MKALYGVGTVPNVCAVSNVCVAPGELMKLAVSVVRGVMHVCMILSVPDCA